ncbi:lamin tail domain-containing protein [Chloroflexota bacterium]
MRKLTVVFSLVMIVVLMTMTTLTVSAKKATPVLVINEIMANPRSVSDSDGEWIEIYNPTSSNIDIDGWTITDGETDHIIDNGGPLVISDKGYLILGSNADSNVNGGVNVAYAYGSYFDGGLGLSNNGDEVMLYDPDGVEVDRMHYNGILVGWGGFSLELINPELDNDYLGSWVRATTPYNGSDLGTPGQPNAFIDELLQYTTDTIETLTDEGVLNSGQSNSLLSKIENVLAKLENDNNTAALNQLSAFINQVNAYVESGILTPGQGLDLVHLLNVLLNLY